jgi:phosphoesterase RecJ-like protein
MPNNKISIKKVSQLLANPTTIAIVPHHNPDGDAIGSALALYHLFTARGHQAQVICPNDYPEFLQWLPGSPQVMVFSKHPKKSIDFLRKAGLLFFVDFNAVSRIEEFREILPSLNQPRILIDHHPKPEDFADLTISDTSVSSTAELIFQHLGPLGLKPFLNVQAAECLFTGILTDTGSFHFNCSNPNTWRTAATLIEQGLDLEKIHSLVYDNFTESRMNLLGFALNEKLSILPKYHTGFIALSREEMQRFKFADGDTEGFVNYPLSVKGISFSALFLERKDHVKISFRSKGEFPVNQFSASFFEGGGHRNAAGGRSDLSLEQTLMKFIDLLSIHHPTLL